MGKLDEPGAIRPIIEPIRQPSFTEAFYRAEKVEPLGLPDYALRIGWTHAHRVPKPFSAQFIVPFDWDALTKEVTETIHRTTVYCYAILNPTLYRLYQAERTLGGEADLNWAYRPSLFWTFCEECETLRVTDRQPPFFTLGEIFPINYFPGGRIIEDLISGNYLQRSEKYFLVAWNKSW